LERIKMLAEEYRAGQQMSEQERADRALVASYCHFNGENRDKLPRDRQRALDRAVWMRQDGYGTPGYTPCQGWDWSGIRDSTAGAFRLMALEVERATR
jgi:hypothetical protein